MDVACFFINNYQYIEGFTSKTSNEFQRVKSESYNFEIEYYKYKDYGKTKDNRYFFHGRYNEFIEVDSAIKHLILRDNFLRYVKAYE